MYYLRINFVLDVSPNAQDTYETTVKVYKMYVDCGSNHLDLKQLFKEEMFYIKILETLKKIVLFLTLVNA